MDLYGEDVCNSNGSKLIKLMQQLDLVLWNCREFCIDPEIRPAFIVDNVESANRDLLKFSSSLHVDSVDIETSDHVPFVMS